MNCHTFEVRSSVGQDRCAPVTGWDPKLDQILVETSEVIQRATYLLDILEGASTCNDDWASQSDET